MDIQIIKKTFSKRDADISELNISEDISKKSLELYLKRLKSVAARQSGHYKSKSGVNVTPQPFWCVEFKVVEKKVGKDNVIQPMKKNGYYIVQTTRWARTVSGTGQEKEKWSGHGIRGPISNKFLYSVVTSAWLVPFSIVHRYLAVIPAVPVSNTNDSHLNVLTNIAQDDRIDQWTVTEDSEDNKTISNWTKTAQNLWETSKKSKSTKLVTDWLDYHGKLTNQKPNTIRVVHTRSRILYAAVLKPFRNTSLGIPLNKAVIKTRSGITIVNTETIPLAGIIIDNLLNSIEVASVDEAYWLSGIFNTTYFGNLTLKKAGGKKGSEAVPSIYSIPVKILDEHGLVFDASNKIHSDISQLSKTLEKQMGLVVKKYYEKNKSTVIDRIGDTVQSPELDVSISRPFIDRLAKTSNELQELERLVKSLF